MSITLVPLPIMNPTLIFLRRGNGLGVAKPAIAAAPRDAERKVRRCMVDLLADANIVRGPCLAVRTTRDQFLPNRFRAPPAGERMRSMSLTKSKQQSRLGHRVVMLGYPRAQILDITGPLEVFARTSRWLRDHHDLQRNAYEIELVAPKAGWVETSGGLALFATRR